jgi:hypothetical protein
MSPLRRVEYGDINSFRVPKFGELNDPEQSPGPERVYANMAPYSHIAAPAPLRHYEPGEARRGNLISLAQHRGAVQVQRHITESYSAQQNYVR